MSCSVFHLTSAATTNLTQLGVGHTQLYGYSIVNTAATALFVKFYWGAPGTFSGGGDLPTVGTDIPALTVGIPTVSTLTLSYNEPIAGEGNLFMATTVNAADTDATAVAAGNLIMSILIG